MSHSVPIDTREITITPVFEYKILEDINASERAGHVVKKQHEMVEIRFAGTKLYQPAVPVHSFWKREGNRILTYADRWPDQYRAFLEGMPAEAAGTPMDMLKKYGVTDAQLSLCRALKIYSIEALHHLEGSALKSLGMSANALKDMARKFMADRAGGAEMAEELAALRAELASLKSERVPADQKAELAKVDDLTAAADEDTRKKALKDEIEAITNARPRGNPTVETLERMLADIKQDA